VTRTYLLEGEHLEFWRERHLCAVTTLRRDGSPHVVPMGVSLGPDADVAWAITSGTSAKVAHLHRDPRIAVNQVDGRRWSTIEGTAEVLEDTAAVEVAVRHYAGRYRQPRENPTRVALRITLTKVIGNV
jgi:PPOX class probable F420-dependent enzyme